MDRKEMLKSVLNDIIHDRTEQATVTMHDYFVAKTREVSGLGGSTEVDADLDAELAALETSDDKE
jgi:hypothetical protein